MTAAKSADVRSHQHPHGFSERRNIGPLRAVASEPHHAAQNLCSLAAMPRDRGYHVHLVNAYTVALADKEPSFADVLGGDSINLPDGKPLSWVSRLRRDKVPLSQVRGLRFMLDVIDHGRSHDLKHYLLGSTEDVLAQLEENLLKAFPGARIAGTHSPPFRPLSDEELIEQDAKISASGAHVVWVGLGTPKQDYESKRLAGALPIIAVAVGAAFDFASGNVKEAPVWIQRYGLEWSYRLMTEPRRLWRRYVFGNARFLRSVLRLQSSTND